MEYDGSKIKALPFPSNERIGDDLFSTTWEVVFISPPQDINFEKLGVDAKNDCISHGEKILEIQGYEVDANLKKLHRTAKVNLNYHPPKTMAIELEFSNNNLNFDLYFPSVIVDYVRRECGGFLTIQGKAWSEWKRYFDMVIGKSITKASS